MCMLICADKFAVGATEATCPLASRLAPVQPAGRIMRQHQPCCLFKPAPCQSTHSVDASHAPLTNLEAARVQQHFGGAQGAQPQRRLLKLGLGGHDCDGAQAQQVAQLRGGRVGGRVGWYVSSHVLHDRLNPLLDAPLTTMHLQWNPSTCGAQRIGSKAWQGKARHPIWLACTTSWPTVELAAFRMTASPGCGAGHGRNT